MLVRATTARTRDMETSINTIEQPSILLEKVNPINFTDGEILISILLFTLILLNIFGGLHNTLIGFKSKKEQYD